jgi:hypothetical protein
MIGCKKVIYNDLLEEWKQNALLIAKAIDIDVDEYIVGDIEETLKILQEKAIVCDIITSRNVIEHIYKLDEFYKIIYNYQSNSIVYSSTTANFNNPAMNLKHVLYHNKVEKIYLRQRIDFLQDQFKQLDSNAVKKLAEATRGYEKSELTKAINSFIAKGALPTKNYYYTNTCNINYGVWAENLLPFRIHKKMINAGNKECIIKPGFWDTHYAKPWKNKMGTFLNTIIYSNESLGFLLAPFIYIIALPKQAKKNS